MAIIQIDEIELFYDIHGDRQGEPLLLIAGFDCDHLFWAAMMPFLVKHYQVIRLDNRGIGQSSAPEQSFSISQMAEDIAALLDALNLKQAHIVGHSMGGQIAQELALAHPEKIQCLILLSSWAKGDEKFNALIRQFGDLALELGGVSYQKMLLPWMFSSSFYAKPSAITQLIQIIEQNPLLPDPNVLYHQSRAILASDTRDRLAQIHCPTLVAVGKEDLLTPVHFSQQLAQGIPNAELIILAGGHANPVESSEAVATLILECCRSSP